MAIEILYDKEKGYKCLYNNASMLVFGCIFFHYEDVQDFLNKLGCNPTLFTDEELAQKVSMWRMRNRKLQNDYH